MYFRFSLFFITKRFIYRSLKTFAVYQALINNLTPVTPAPHDSPVRCITSSKIGFDNFPASHTFGGPIELRRMRTRLCCETCPFPYAPISSVRHRQQFAVPVAQPVGV
jgi:hypothetical protein